MNFLPYLPQHYTDESFYSYFARYRRDLGLSQHRALLDVFGETVRISTSGLQAGLSKALPRLRSPQFPDLVTLVEKTTSFGYYTAFLDEERTKQLQENRNFASARLGLGLAGVRPNPFMRLCPACVTEMESRYADVYWRRAHQLPGVLVCCDHGTLLVETTVKIDADSNMNSVCAEDACRQPTRPIIKEPTSAQAYALLLELAKRSAALLSARTRLLSAAERAQHYGERLRAAGFTKGRLIAKAQVKARFSAFLAPAEPHIAGIGPYAVGNRTTAALWCQYKSSQHPVRHIMFQMFLDTATSINPNDRGRLHDFGEGPWKCRNTLCDDHNCPVVRVFWLSERLSVDGRKIGNFSCDVCGFTFSLTGGLDGPMRVLARGPRYTELIQELAPHFTAGHIARKIGGDTTVVRKHAALAKIQLLPPRRHQSSKRPKPVERIRENWLHVLASHPGSTRTQLRQHFSSLIRRLETEDRGWFEKHYPPRIPRKSRDWEEVEQCLCDEIVKLAAEMRRTVPLIRVSARQILLKVGAPEWWQGRHYSPKLPRAFAALKAVDESIEDFQRRRLDWAISEMQATGKPLYTSNVRRVARIASKNWKMVAEALKARGVYIPQRYGRKDSA